MDNEYMDELREILDSAVEGLPLDYAERRTLTYFTDGEHEVGEHDIEQLANIIQKARKAGPPPRMMEEFEIKASFHIGDNEVVFGEAKVPCAEHGNAPYLVATCTYNSALGAMWPEKMTAYTSYTSAVAAFSDGLSSQSQQLKAEREQRGHNPPLGVEHCIEGSDKMDYTGQVVVYDAKALRPECRYADNQLFLASGGFGCKPDAYHGRAVFSTNLYTGEDARLNRPEILGIIQPELMPEWAKEKLAEIQHRAANEKSGGKRPAHKPKGKDAR